MLRINKKIKSVNGLVATLAATILMGSSNTHRTITLRSTEAENVEKLTCAQKVKFVSMLLEETSEFQKLAIFTKIIKELFSYQIIRKRWYMYQTCQYTPPFS